MESLLLLGVALAPGMAGFMYYYKKDSLQREPLRILLAASALGALAVIPAGLLEAWIWPEDVASVQDAILQSFLVIAPAEEFVRLLAIVLIVRLSRHFDEIVDGVVYGAAVGAGFATLENIFYVMENGFAVGFLRAFLSVPLHIFWGVAIGHGVALWKAGRRWPLPFLIALAIFLHGAFDAVLLAPGEKILLQILLPIFFLVLMAFTSAVMLRRSLLEDGLSASEIFSGDSNWGSRALRAALAGLAFLLGGGGLFMLLGSLLLYLDNSPDWPGAAGIGLFLLICVIVPAVWKKFLILFVGR